MLSNIIKSTSLNLLLSHPPREAGTEGQDIGSASFVRIDVDHILFDEGSKSPAKNISAEDYADSRVPVTEDGYRCIKQLIIMLGDVKKNELVSQLLTKIFPDVPTNIILVINSLCTAVNEKKHIDSAVLNCLSLASWYLPIDINIISRLAAFIRETIINWTGASFLREDISEDDGYQAYLYTSLAVAIVAASYFITSPSAPQRGLFQVPAFVANLMLRVHYYWRALGGMVQPDILLEEPAVRPAFEVDSSIETVSYLRPSADFSMAKGPPETLITAFTSNSTVDPEAYTTATVENRSMETPGVTDSVEKQAQAWVIGHLMRHHLLSRLLHCTAHQTQTQHYQDGVKTTHTHINMKCGAIKFPEPLSKPATSFERQTKESASLPNSAAESSHIYSVIPMAASSGPVVNTWIQALRSKVARVAGGAAVLAGAAFIGRKIWNSYAAKNAEEAVIQPSQDAYKDRKPHRWAERESINAKLTETMQKFRILEEARMADSFKKEEIIAAVGIYLFAPDPRFTHYAYGLDKRLINVAKKILKEKKLYGGGRYEEVSPARAGIVVRNWLFDNVLGMPVEPWLAGKLAALNQPRQYNVSDMKSLLNSDSLRSTRIIDLEGIGAKEIEQLYRFWDYALDNTLPFKNFLAAEEVASQTATDDAFVWLHSGALWLKDAGAELSEFSAEECQALGRIIWQRVESGDMDMSYLRYLTLPALLFEAVNHPKKVSHRKKHGFILHLKVVKQYAEYRSLVADLRVKAEAFNVAGKNWTSRGDIAAKYVEQCPEDRLMQMGHWVGNGKWVPIMNNPRETPDKILRRGRDFAKNRYLNDVTPIGCPDFSVTAEYDRKTRELADTFSAVDEYMLAAAMGGLKEKELHFIRSEGAVISLVVPSLSCPLSIPAPEKQLIISDLFSVVVGNQERIYAFVRPEGDKVVIRRVDRTIDDYLQYDIFDAPELKRMRGRRFVIPQVYSSCEFLPSYRLHITTSLRVVDLGEGAPENIVNHFKVKRRSEFYDRTRQAGYNETPEKIVIEILKSFIPFYDCINGKFPYNIISCVLDVISFIPLVGQVAGLTGKFGVNLSRAINVGVKLLPSGALSTNIAKAAGKQALKQIHLPTISELTLLSKTAVQTLDPGFELLAGVGKFSYKGISELTDWVRAGKNADDMKNIEKIIYKINTVDAKISDQVFDFKKAYLPNSKLKIPVKAVRLKNRKELYVIVDPVTGEGLGRFYYLDGEKLVPSLPPKALFRTHEKKIEKKNWGKKKRGPDATGIVPICSRRPKRGIEELCAATSYAHRGNHFYIDLGRGEKAFAFRLPYLKMVNMVRYQIVEESLRNAYSLCQTAKNKVTGMSQEQIIMAFGKYAGTSISGTQADSVKNKVMEIAQGSEVYYQERDKRVILISDDIGDLAYVVPHELVIMITDSFFVKLDPAMAAITLIHEISHGVAKTDDLFYYPSNPTIGKKGLSLLDFCIRYNKDIYTVLMTKVARLMKRPDMSLLVPGDDLFKKLNIPDPNNDAAIDRIFLDGMKDAGITRAEISVNNADSLAFFIMGLGIGDTSSPLVNINQLFKSVGAQEEFPTHHYR
ncbi:hypothetical protein [Erwinia tasmaniensis]|uniref:Uncharacterized protein n=1 Tax=Erwinia tasmaniensis (strain DSM 17950 / CFBP 7177 / CIP 109463 / NCPPB 4357 / Et1/99) TaxID=465817 RepID=B2VIL8_ERWT9|nr:hypothetical protein [Erwinia tasmaniensis]CAO96273.1 Hypothetical protein ETA_12270 [Erwinia tasmaniensis Et1/99]